MKRWLLALALSLSGCDDGAPPVDAESPAKTMTASIQTDSTDYAVTRDGPGWTAVIGFRYTAGADTVYVVNCNGAILMNLQKREEGRWTDAWYAEGDQCLSEPIVILPGTEFRGEVRIWGAEMGETSFNTFRVPVIDGVYRLVWNQPVEHYGAGSGTFGDTLALGDRVSNEFRVRAAVLSGTVSGSPAAGR